MGFASYRRQKNAANRTMQRNRDFFMRRRKIHNSYSNEFTIRAAEQMEMPGNKELKKRVQRELVYELRKRMFSMVHVLMVTLALLLFLSRIPLEFRLVRLCKMGGF